LTNFITINHCPSAFKLYMVWIAKKFIGLETYFTYLFLFKNFIINFPNKLRVIFLIVRKNIILILDL